MFLNLKNQKIPVEKISEGKIKYSEFENHESIVLKFIYDWITGKKNFQFRTSGSTGAPKIIHLSREILEYSARNTIDFLGLPESGKSLLCIPPQFIGGSMVVIRSLINNMDLTILPPSSKPTIETTYDLISMVPLQLSRFLDSDPSKLKGHRAILIGGAPIYGQIEERLLSNDINQIYATYGMTETASHVALRKIGTSDYLSVGDVIFRQEDDLTLSINGTVTSKEWMKTHDLVELTSKGFRWIGRKDFVINSGGIKISAEELERKLARLIPGNFVISWIPDAELGQKIVLVMDKKVTLPELHPALENPNLRPRKLFLLPAIITNEAGKVDRLRIHNLIKDAVPIRDL